jgi:hypothetical protein
VRVERKKDNRKREYDAFRLADQGLLTIVSKRYHNHTSDSSEGLIVPDQTTSRQLTHSTIQTLLDRPGDEARRLTLSIMMSHASSVLRDRPRDLGNVFGLNLGPNFLCCEFPPSLDRGADIKEARVVGGWVDQLDHMDHAIADPSQFVGRKLSELACPEPEEQDATDAMSNAFKQMLISGSAPPLTIQIHENKKTIVSPSGKCFMVRFRGMAFIDDVGRPKWLLLSVLDEVLLSEKKTEVESFDAIFDSGELETFFVPGIDLLNAGDLSWGTNEPGTPPELMFDDFDGVIV